MTLSRRDFVKLATVAGAAPFAGRVFGHPAACGRDTLVCIFQRGGMDGLNVVPPLGDPLYATLRPKIHLARPGASAPSGIAAIDLDGFFGLNPAAIALKPVWDAGDLAIVHAVGADHGNRSHFSAQDMMERADWSAGSALADGWLGRHLATLGTAPDVPFRAVGVGTAIAPSLRGSMPVMGMDSIDGFALAAGPAIALPLADFYAGAAPLERAGVQVFDAIAALDAADPSSYASAPGANYPDTEFGREMREVAQLIKSGIGLEIACVDIGGWDHHNRLNDALTPLLREFAETLAAFHADLGALMDGVTVVSMSEFGRRLAENGSQGADHGHAGVMFAMGAGVIGGKVYGTWPGLADADDGDLRINTDYRRVLAELLGKRCGNPDLDRVFPQLGSAPADDLGIFMYRGMCKPYLSAK